MALDLIAPEVPTAQSNRGPDLFQQSFGTGLAAVVRFSEMKRNSETELLRIAERERMSQEQTALEREKMALDADYRSKMLETTSELNRERVNLMRSQADAWKTGTARGWQNTVAFNQQREALVNEVNNSANELKLNDPDFATKQPVQYAANVMKFRDMYALSPLTEVKGAITQFQRTADQQKISLKVGATYDEDKEEWLGGTEKQVPIWQVVKNLSDPMQQEATTNALEASGHLKVIEDFETINGTQVPRTRRELVPALKSAIENEKDVTFEREESRVPPAMLRRSDSRGTTPTPLPDPDLPAPEDDPQARNTRTPQFEETETDRLIGQAKAAIAKGAPKDAVAARLQELGIDPTEALAA